LGVIAATFFVRQSQPSFLDHATMEKKSLVTKNIINYNKIWKTNLANNFDRTSSFSGSTVTIRVVIVH
jgi:membrane protein involved in colicin uptake